MAGIDPAPERCRVLPDLYRAGIPIFPDLQDFFAQDHADLDRALLPYSHARSSNLPGSRPWRECIV